MLIELRSTGCQTVAPPSLHPSGEVVRWERGDPGRGEECEPGIVTGAALRRAVGRVAAAALLARRWPGEGQRDEAAKDLAGLLLRGGWDAPETDRFIRLVARLAGDEEWRKRAKAKRTAEKLAAGQPVTGGPSLAERLGYHSGDGERVVARLRDWLDLSGTDAAGAPTLAQKSTLAHSQNVGKSDMMGKSEGGMAPRVDVVTVLARDVKRTSVRWLWPGRIPLGKITLLDGDPGLGKSLLTIDLAARVTTGSAMPDGSPGIAGGGGAVLLSSEDDPADTIVPRLEAAAADLARVVLVQEVSETSESATGAESDGTEQGLSRQFLLPRDIPRLEQAIRQVDARLVVIDPLMSYLDSRINSWRDQDMRATLTPLAKLAERMGTAVLILRHLNKATGMSPIHRGGGSIGIIGAARAGLLVAKHPDNPEYERVLAVTKSNLGPPPPSLRYQLVAPLSEVEGLDDEGIEYLRDVPVVEWLGTSEMTASTLLAAPTADENPEHLSKEEEAMEWLRETLADGPHLTGEVEHAALAAGITKKTLRRARERMGVITIRQGQGDAHVARWSLPEPAAS